MNLEAHGLRIELPRGWSGRVFRRADGLATLHVGDFQLPQDENSSFGVRSTSKMPQGASFFVLTEYRPDKALKPGTGLFEARSIPLPLDPAAFSPSALARARPNQVGMQHFFTASERPFCLYVVLAGPRSGRRRQLLALDHLLRSLRIEKRS